ncbi:alpha/beta fold hydrolase [Chitinophaga lutea]
MQLSVTTTGHGATALVFLHQANGSSRIWDQQINDSLFSAYARVCIDLPGHGASHAAGDYSLPALGRLLAPTLEALPYEQYVLVTLSISGCLAAEALPSLTRCKGLFAAGSSLIGGNVTPATVMRPFEHGMVLFDANPSDEALAAYLGGLTRHRVNGTHNTMTADYRRTDPAFRTGLAVSLGKGQWSDQLGNAAAAGVPVGFVYGDDDRIIDPAYLEAAALRQWRGVLQTVADAGHLVNVDQPVAFNRLLSAFLQDCQV